MQFISLKAPCCLPHLNGVTGAVSCTGDVLVSRSTRAGGWAYLGDLFHNCRPCRSVLSIPFGITLGSHQCARLEKNRQLFAYSAIWWVSLLEIGIQGKLWWSIWRKSDVSVKELSCTDMEGHCLWMTLCKGLSLNADVRSMNSWLKENAFYFVFLRCDHSGLKGEDTMIWRALNPKICAQWTLEVQTMKTSFQMWESV